MCDEKPEVWVLEHDLLRVETVPAIGGRIISLFHKPSGTELLWRNAGLELRRSEPGAAYDPEFFGGIDEQIPCDGPEIIDGIAYPDHGELWTCPLEASRLPEGGLLVCGKLPLLGFEYRRILRLDSKEAALSASYEISNFSGCRRTFLWKLHAAAAVGPGDRIVSSAGTARPLDSEWSRCRNGAPFPWPWYGEIDMSAVPEADGTSEFLALEHMAEGSIGIEKRQLRFMIDFDPVLFPCCWVFASYGKLLGHYTVVLEPSTHSSLHVGAWPDGTAFFLEPEESVKTEVMFRVED